VLTVANLSLLEEIIGVSFNQPSLLEQALRHSSYCHENAAPALDSNERLEFLGDAILGLLIAEKLYHDLPAASEGELTKLRTSLVRSSTLARLARAMELGKQLYLGRGEELSGGRDKANNLAGALEAVIAATFIDQGLTTTRNFILKLFSKELENLTSQGAAADYKSQLQELLQSRGQAVPSYYLVETRGPDHARTFTVEVRAGNTILGRGTGKSKKIAETEAARDALENPTEPTM
jgi:ribonuclease-3